MFSIHQLLIFAARAGNIELMRERIAAGADVSYYDQQHGAALLVAIAGQHTAAVEFLLSQGVDVCMTDARGLGALEYALRFQDDDIASLLLRNGARLQPHARHRFKDLLTEHLKRIGVRNDKPTT